jgi:uncharacterized protein (DUF885 family)
MLNFMRIEKIDQELSSIFKSPEILSVEKHRELNLIKEQIDKIYMRNSLSQVEDIYSQMNAIYKSNIITKSQEQTLVKLEKKLNQLFINKSKADIAPEDEHLLEILNAKIDSLYRMKEPTLEEIEKAENLLDEKEARYASFFIQKGQAQTYLC